ncbi:MAG: hypothetical protein CMJ64_11855 [Planctomycetaceae bacterium]|nr:hypothetical protein [Planctomycetaceae bacterium]
MNLELSTLLLVTLLMISPARPMNAAENVPHQLSPAVATYFKQYCYRCHGETTQKGDRRLDLLPTNMKARSDAATLLEEALDAINRGDMPPAKKGVLQPPAGETKRIVATITTYLSRLSSANSIQATMMRRLNRFEYVNTMRDLLGLRRESFDVTADFPVDATEHGFDNNGEALTLSDHQLQRYLEVAEASLDAASFFDVKRPNSQRWNYTGKDFNGVQSYERAPVTWRLIVDDEYMEIGHGQPSERHPNFTPPFVRQGGVPADGWYTISVKAAAANRLDHGYDHGEFDRFKTQRLKLALWIAPSARLLDKNAADQRQLLKVWDLPDAQPDVFTQRAWLNKGAIPFVSWTNGVSSKGNIRRVAEKHHAEVIRATKTQLDAAKLGNPEAKALVAKLAKNANNKLLSEVYQGPRIRVWHMAIEGPDYQQWPPASHRLLFGDETDASKIDIDQTVMKFATRAFRQPVSPAEVEHYAIFIRDRVSDGDSHAKAIKLGLAAILTSPRFLYLDEGNDEGDKELTPHELAARLSYFLWSSMPDGELIEAAESGKLDTPDGLTTQTDRMLRDDKADAFVEHFTDTWLRINTLGSMPPDPKAFESYYRNRLEELLKRETRLFFSDLLETNGSIVNLLDSDYTFVNDALATHYGISNIRGEHFRKVALKPEHRRGGLLGQGSVLTLSANGIETSPVVRGIWVLENILGTPPPPPPPDVPAIEPDTRGTTTIREQLNKHRTVAACADCHQKIDPAGFALEFFDPIGGFRTRYPGRGKNRPAIDGFGQLPTGETFEDERGLKKLLIARKDRFTEALTEKLMTYATGRSMTYRDQPDIKQIAAESAKNGYGLRNLIRSVVTSKTFHRR